MAPAVRDAERWRRGPPAGLNLDARWSWSLDQLIQFKAIEGHVKVPRDRGLGNWVSTQRTNYRRGLLQAGRFDRLNEIGFFDEVEGNADGDADAEQEQGGDPEEAEEQGEENGDEEENNQNDEVEHEDDEDGENMNDGAEDGYEEQNNDNHDAVPDDAPSSNLIPANIEPEEYRFVPHPPRFTISELYQMVVALQHRVGRLERDSGVQAYAVDDERH